MQTEDLKESSKQTTAEEKHLSRKLKRIQPMLLMESMRLPGKRVRELLEKKLLNRMKRMLRSKNCRTVF